MNVTNPYTSVVYISLPITGLDEAKQRSLALAWQTYLNALPQVITVNPFDLWDSYIRREGREPSYVEIMEECRKAMEHCTDAIFLNGWEHSGGCKTEMVWAIERRMSLYFDNSFKLS